MTRHESARPPAGPGPGARVRKPARGATPRRMLATVALVLVAACGGGSDAADGWTQAQKDDVARFLRAVRGAERVTGGSAGAGAEETLRTARRALRAAKRVDDAVLDRMHPRLRRHFRGELQEGLERRVRSLERGGAAAGLRGDRLLRAWAAWYGVHRAQLRMP